MFSRAWRLGQRGLRFVCPPWESSGVIAPSSGKGKDRSGFMRAPTGILLHFFCIALVVQGCATMARVVKQEYIRGRSALSTSKIAIILDESFIDTYKDRATIDVMFTVDKAGKRPHPAFLDGDLHVAGRAPGTGLPVVAEIKNAAFERGAVGVIRSVAGTGGAARLAGGGGL